MTAAPLWVICQPCSRHRLIASLLKDKRQKKKKESRWHCRYPRFKDWETEVRLFGTRRCKGKVGRQPWA